MELTRRWAATVRLALKNIWRWRGRVLATSGLVALTFGIYVLYGGLLLVSGAKGAAKITPLRVPADIMVITDYAVGLRPEQFPTPKYSRKILDYSEEAVLLKTYSRLGEMDLLGIKADSRFYPFEQMGLVGSKPTSKGDLVVPQHIAQAQGLSIGDRLAVTAFDPTDGAKASGEFTVVGLFSPSYDLAQPIGRMEDLLALKSRRVANCYLINKLPQVDLIHLVDWMESVFPSATRLSALTPVQMGERIAGERYQPGRSVLSMIYLFMGIGVMTIALFTFLQRRRELAVLKSIGISNQQTMMMLGFEQASAAVLGLLGGWQMSRFVGSQLSWFAEIAPSSLASLSYQGVAFTVIVVALATLLPTLTAKVATVNQLLYARSIPIQVERLSELRNAYAWCVERQEKEGVRLLRLDVVDGHFDGALLKKVGDPVKRGEAVAAQESYFGLKQTEWFSPVDGVVTEYNSQNGYLAIRPYDMRRLQSNPLPLTVLPVTDGE